MRKILLITSLWLIGQCLISQNLNIAEHRSIDQTGGIISINSKFFYLGSSIGGCCGYGIYLRGIDNNGDTLFSRSLPGQMVRFFGTIIKTQDNAIFLNYYTVASCDTYGELDYITKIDTNGTILFNVAIQSTAASGFSRTINDITQHTDGSYYLVSSTDLYHYSSSGQFISKINTGLTNISLVKALNNGKLFLSGKVNGINSNVVMSTSGTVLKQHTCTNVAIKMMEGANHYFTRSASSVFEKYDTSLVLKGSFDGSINPIVYKTNDFMFRNDSIFVVGNKSAPNVLYYAVLDTALNMVFQSQSNYKGITPTGIALNNKNKVSLITTCNSKIVPAYSFTGLYQFGINGTFVSKSDIGVTGFSNLNTISDVEQGGLLVPYINMDATIKNFGTDTVKSFYLNYYAQFDFCLILFHKEYFTPVSPGGTVSVATGTFYGQPGYPGVPGHPVPFAKLNICLFTTIPNASNDIEIDNDAYCDSILFVATGVDENSPLSQSLQIYPNPFTDNFTISSGVEIKAIAIFNSLGELMLKETIKSKEYSFSEKTLDPGIYFIKIETEKGFVLKKIIKN